MSSSLPSSPSRPPCPLSPVVDRPRRQAITRACDRCRRRKAKCDFDGAAGTCSHCRDSHIRCTFDLPLAKRGPKSKKRADSSIPPESVSTFAGRRSLHQPPLVGRTAGSTAAATFKSPSNSSTAASWEPATHLDLGPGLSPTSTRDFASIASPPAVPHGVSAVKRWHNLSRALALRNKALEPMVEQCFGLFFEYLYPLTPLVHEPSLRDGLSIFTSRSSSPALQNARRNGIGRVADTLPALNPPAWPGISPDVGSGPGGETLACWHDATFTLITAVCAEAAFLLPKDLFPEGETVADLFLQASRDCLKSYLEVDLESPNANSITIRYFHSNCVHAAGKPKYSWHIFGEATRLAQVMRLYDETSLEGLPHVESELRRRAFWIVYMGDKSAAILNNRPITMHKYSFETGVTTAYPTGMANMPTSTATMSDVTEPPDSYSSNLIAGFNANLRLWQAASDLLIQVRLFQDERSLEYGAANPPSQALTEPERQRLDSLFVQFITCMDDLPHCLHSYTFASVGNAGGPVPEAKQFVVQCANLQVSFHCLRMVITQKFEDIAFFAPGAEQADLRKTEIVRDMLRVMHEAPFWSLQVNGEPYVEKIRLIGATLLSIIHRNQASPLAARARSDFSVLLDILTRLDSKASDALKNTSKWAL
ncbi:Zn(2)-C6 fungal-type DNA-binding domain protein [Metarhizium rileyi]|uniref:Zn(2)-C6 fungal-type DNA-binding domain protein n=1 Tax=Metarhizium rileyi (strain RCEF 4871) TaxID=1649241 RepID=A0A167JRA0_METRR|nr:Zn(2)-C6 fungal-type DNA-binding domain protein [Metarhizium rileyi RCEF 4871]